MRAVLVLWLFVFCASLVFAQTITFTDDPLLSGVTPVKAVHISELRAAVNDRRGQRGLAPFTFTDTMLSGGGVEQVRAIHLAELRTALDPVFDSLGLSRPTYTDPVIASGSTAIKGVHIAELRSAVNAATPINGAPSATVSAMLQALPSYIISVISENLELLPRNPQNAALIQAKITMLQNPNLVTEITSGRRWAESNASRIPIAALFPLETMRSEADLAVRALVPVVPLLEDFLAVPFPTQDVRVWYGFKIGNTGGGGSIFTEDRTTYESRTPANRLPFDAILAHEAAHSYFGNESLTQFLELYAYNVIATGSQNVSAWIYLRNWTPGLASNMGIHALLDIYQAIGFDEMSRAYRAIYPLHPGALSAAMIQAFANQVNAAQRAFVIEKLGQVP